MSSIDIAEAETTAGSRRSIAKGAAPEQARSMAAAAVRRALTRAILPLLVPFGLLAVWFLFSRWGVFDPQLMPAPAEVADELAYLIDDGTLLTHILVTVERLIWGFAWGALAATALGAATGYSRLARTLLDPTIQALKAVPSLAWVPLFILWFGIFETSKITLIAIGAFFPIYLNLMTGIQDVDRKLVEVGRIMGLNQFQLVWRVLIPATLPAYLTGLRGGLALAWMFVVAAELMGASEGLGFLMIDGQMTGRPAIIIGALILFAIAGKLSDAALGRFNARLLRWQDSFGVQEHSKS
ncbi:MAG: ABC transporter permease [Alphaproteobacteria bacterium]|nr:ABC transporter permease [Alphaproteobacteria bacterium]